jgi:histidine triad (HIT) family protein
MPTLFEKIISRDLPSEIVYEDKHIIVIKDIFPKAPTHLLIIPKKPIKDLQSVEPEDLFLMQEIVSIAQKLASQFKLVPDGYRLLVNVGSFGGQEIPHLHFHLLGGKPLGELG